MKPNEANAEHNWVTFGAAFSECFFDHFPYIPHDKAPPECAWAVGRTKIAIDRDFRRVEAPFNSSVEQTIRAVCGTWLSPKLHSPSVPPSVAYFVGLRSAVLLPFFIDLSASPAPTMSFEVITEIIPFPLLAAPRVAEWFLIDWWRANGPRRACEMRLVDEALPV
jgi:hypothetical protein